MSLGLHFDPLNFSNTGSHDVSCKVANVPLVVAAATLLLLPIWCSLWLFVFLLLSSDMISFQGDDITFMDTQMPKRSRTEDRAKGMVGKGEIKAKEKPKTSNTAQRKGKGGPINIPLDNISPELKKILVKELVREGKAKLIKRGKKKE